LIVVECAERQVRLVDSWRQIGADVTSFSRWLERLPWADEAHPKTGIFFSLGPSNDTARFAAIDLSSLVMKWPGASS
jgi:hypothetical protein